MLQSMTAFASMQREGAWGSLVCEIRSVNQRYLEVDFRLPPSLASLETELLARVRQCIKRGKLHCFLRYDIDCTSPPPLMLDLSILTQLAAACETLDSLFKHTAAVNLNVLELLRWPGVLKDTPSDAATMVLEQARLLFDETLMALVATRVREGDALKPFFLTRLQAMHSEIANVRQRLPTLLAEQKTRLHRRCADVIQQVDSTRFEHELVLFMQKIDVSEELERLEAHLAETQRSLNYAEPVGRRLDFLMQELNREANTLASKSVDVATTQAAIALKVLIEQLREQIQNIQ